MGRSQYSVDELLTKATILPAKQEKLQGYTTEDKIKLIEYISNTYTVGDMLTSSAAFDPTFWPLHGQLEKLVGLKRINAALGLDEFDMTFEFIGNTIALRGGL